MNSNKWAFVGQRFHIEHGCRSLCGRWGFIRGDDVVKPGRMVAGDKDCKECVKRWNACFPKEPDAGEVQK